MRVVLDTNILVSATMWNDSFCNKLIKTITEKEIEIFTSYEILEEYKEVLRRDFKYEEEDVHKIILELLLYMQVIEPITKIKAVFEDPDDDKVIECALESNSEYVLSYDKHLLNLKEFRGIKIITPEKFLDNLNKINNL